MNYLIHAYIVIVCKVHFMFKQVLVTFHSLLIILSETIFLIQTDGSLYSLDGYKIFTIFTISIIESLTNSLALTRVIKNMSN